MSSLMSHHHSLLSHHHSLTGTTMRAAGLEIVEKIMDTQVEIQNFLTEIFGKFQQNVQNFPTTHAKSSCTQTKFVL